MVVYRLSSTKYANDLTGEGARINGGRWNHVDTRCLYTSANRALAVLEYSVNVNLAVIIRNLSMVTIDIPNDILEITIPELPGDWKDAPAPTSTKDFGTHLLKRASHPIIRIPSTVIPEEYNYLVNPNHPLAAGCIVLDVKDFVYDVRIKMT